MRIHLRAQTEEMIPFRPVQSLFLALSLSLFSLSLCAQDDLMSMLEDEADANDDSRVYATFKTMKAVNLHTIEMVKKKSLDFRVTHRFGNMGAASGGGVHNLWGFDNSDDIRLSFDYGITEDLQVGFGRSKRNELIDASVKYRILAQTSKKVPISLVALVNFGFTPQQDLRGYFGSVAGQGSNSNRFNYMHQLIIARKFGERFSLELLPTHVYQNLAIKDNSGEDSHSIFAMGFAARVKLTQRVAIIGDYTYIASDYRRNHSERSFHDPLGVGIEVETGGHVFHLTLTNASGIVENNFLLNTTDDWLQGGIKMGFNISRVFNLNFKGGGH